MFYNNLAKLEFRKLSMTMIDQFRRLLSTYDTNLYDCQYRQRIC